MLFSIKANKNISNYHLAVKETNEPVPTTTEMVAGALKRNLGTNSINVLIAQRLNAPIVTFAKKYFSDNTHQTLGMNMLKTLHTTQNFGLIYDGSAAGTEAWVKESVLKASTGYTLYGMEEGGDQVEVLQTFVTDAVLEVPTTGPERDYADSTLEKGHIEIAVKDNELYIFPLQVQMNTTNELNAINFYFSEQIAGDTLVVPGNTGEAGNILVPDIGYTDMLYLFKDMGSRVEIYANGGIYVLTDTAHNQNSFNYGVNYNLGGDLGLEEYTVLLKQQ